MDYKLSDNNCWFKFWLSSKSVLQRKCFLYC